MSKNVDGVKVQNQGDLVIYNGHKYQYNKDITSILFMGVDRDKINTDEEYLKKHGAGQSDTLFLAAVNFYREDFTDQCSSRYHGVR